ncbi:MAG: hypothetical protein HYU41_13155 [Candidatus Rokubacteria bacterium]|nr:hypothetical protein [Candidatus Rokubacteria bacterium]
MRSVTAAIAAVALLAWTARVASGHSVWCAPPATTATFTASVRHGEAFERTFGRNLVFRLAPSRDPSIPGWTIEVRARGDANPERELSWLVTPPYRSWNPRYLDLSYGRSAGEAVALTPREFAYLTDVADFERAAAAVKTLLWPGTARTSSWTRPERRWTR